VNLPAAGQGPIAGKEFEKTAAVFVNVFRDVFVKAGEIERVPGHRTDAAAPRRITVGEAVLFKRRANQRPHAVVFAPVKASILEFCIFRDCFHRHRHYRSSPRT